MSTLDLQIESVELGACHEIAVSRASSALGSDWPVQPGAVRRTPEGKPEALHIAPGRWMLPDASANLLAQLEGRPELSVVDVEGKWRRRTLRGKDALRLLACGADVEAMLAGRECAVVSLFDCPVVVARSLEGIDLWVHASYAQFLDEQLAKARTRMPA